MTSGVSVTIKNNFPQYQARAKAKSEVATQQMAADILRLGKQLAPYDPGTKTSGKHLVQTGTVRKVNANTYAISFGEGLSYGRWWEFNDTMPPGTNAEGVKVHFQAGRQSKYLRSSVETVAGDPSRVQLYYTGALT